MTRRRCRADDNHSRTPATLAPGLVQHPVPNEPKTIASRGNTPIDREQSRRETSHPRSGSPPADFCTHPASPSKRSLSCVLSGASIAGFPPIGTRLDVLSITCHRSTGVCEKCKCQPNPSLRHPLASRNRCRHSLCGEWTATTANASRDHGMAVTSCRGVHPERTPSVCRATTISRRSHAESSGHPSAHRRRPRNAPASASPSMPG
jgi:hypothetical protein